jgi:RNA-binding protein
MEKLKGSEKKYLRSMAHHLKPVALVGKNGIGGRFLPSVDAALNDHELIKIKFGEFKEEKKEMAAQIAAQTQSEVVGIIGNIVIIYRRHSRPELRRIKL